MARTERSSYYDMPPSYQPVLTSGMKGQIEQIFLLFRGCGKLRVPFSINNNVACGTRHLAFTRPFNINVITMRYIKH